MPQYHAYLSAIYCCWSCALWLPNALKKYQQISFNCWPSLANKTCLIMGEQLHFYTSHAKNTTASNMGFSKAETKTETTTILRPRLNLLEY